MRREDAARLLRAVAGRTALCVGDVIADAFVYGSTRRISREAPVPVLAETGRTAMLGGAGNLARNIASLGGTPMLVGVAGDDAEGDQLAELVTACAGANARLVREPGRLTPTKIRYVSNNQQMLCVDRNPAGPIRPDTEEAVLAAVAALLPQADVLILSDYGRGLITPAVSRGAISLAREAGVPVSVDPRGSDYSRYDGADVIKPNADELAEEAGLPVETDAETEAALHAVLECLSLTRAILVTRSARGMALLERGASVIHHRARPRSVFDVSGAGDTALAALSLAMAAGTPLADAMALADTAAGAAVAKTGTATVSPDEVLQDAEGGSGAPDWRILSRSEAAELAQSWRAQGLTVGFTNGCFDILHPGHLAVLRHARSVCDRLIVGLNDDESVRRLKGPERPINSVGLRAQMLASLETVDRVVVFEEDTPQALIEAVSPHVLVKGADYADPDSLPGAAHVKAQGGTVVLAPLEEGLSTTGIVERIRQAEQAERA